MIMVFFFNELTQLIIIKGFGKINKTSLEHITFVDKKL